MEVGQLQRHWADLMTSLFREGLLDDQYTQLQQLQDESNPDFVIEVVSLFFDDSEKLLNDLTGVLNEQPLDFKKVDAHVHQLKGSSSSIGAQRVKNVCVAFRSCCEAKKSRRMSQMSSAGEAGILFGEEQTSDLIQAGATDFGCWWISPFDDIATCSVCNFCQAKKLNTSKTQKLSMNRRGCDSVSVLLCKEGQSF